MRNRRVGKDLTDLTAFGVDHKGSNGRGQSLKLPKCVFGVILSNVRRLTRVTFKLSFSETTTSSV